MNSHKYHSTNNIWFWACFFMALFLVGCSAEDTVDTVEKTQLTVWYYWDFGKSQQALSDILDGFNKSQDRIVVKAQYVPDEFFKKKLALSMADGTMPYLAFIDSADFKYLHAMEPLVDLSEELVSWDNYLNAATQSCTIDGHIYGFSFGMNCPTLFYNKTMPGLAGCKATQSWKEFYETAVKAADGEKNGFALPALQREETLYCFLPILWSIGREISVVDSQESTDAFSLLWALSQEKGLSRQCINLTLSGLAEQLAVGNIAMMFHSSMAIVTICMENPELDFDIVLIPSSKESVIVAGGEVLGITHGENQDYGDILLEAAKEIRKTREGLL